MGPMGRAEGLPTNPKHNVFGPTKYGNMIFVLLSLVIWEFPKIRGTLFWGPYNKDPTI